MNFSEIADIVQKAYELRQNNKFEEMYELLKPIIDSHPIASALLLTADYMRKSDDFSTRAIEEKLRLGTKLSPESPDGYLELAHFLHIWNDSNEEVQALLTEARRLIEIAATSADLLEGSILQDENKYVKANAFLQKACQRHPKSKLLKEDLSLVQRFLDRNPLHKDDD